LPLAATRAVSITPSSSTPQTKQISRPPARPIAARIAAAAAGTMRFVEEGLGAGRGDMGTLKITRKRRVS
jgi:hypothetical protein